MAGSEGPLRAVVASIPRVISAGFAAAVTMHTGDPITGAVVGEVFAAAGDDFVARVLSPRQEERVATVLDLASVRVATYLEEGEELRSDGLFESATTESVEVVEGVLLAAQNEHQAKKLAYMANLLANVAFHSEITVNLANQVIADAESLTWLDLCLLSIHARPDDFPLPDYETNNNATDWGDWGVMDSFLRLIERGYLVTPYRPPSEPGRIPRADRKMSAVEVTNRGTLLRQLMELEQIPRAELEEAYRALCRAVEPAAEESSDGDKPTKDASVQEVVTQTDASALGGD